MTLKEISYMVLELMRGGAIVDDERMDPRLIYKFINTKRAEFTRSQIERRYGISPNATQDLQLPVVVEQIGGETYLTVNEVPSFLNTRFGLAIQYISTDIYKNVMFKYVPVNELPYVGNGRFNKAIVYGTYSNGRILLKSKNIEFSLVSNITVSGVLNDPTKHPDFDEETSEYPIDYDGLEYVKNEALSKDVRIFMGGVPDEVNDGSGEIKA